MSKREAGRLGGMATFAKHGREYMQEIGKRGAMKFHETYSLKPYGQYQWAIVRRADSVIIRTQKDWR